MAMNPQRAPPSAAELYSRVPSYRRNGTMSALLFVALASAFLGPVLLRTVVPSGGVAAIVGFVFGAPLLIVCAVVLTGDVYMDTLDKTGLALKKWGVLNKVVAALIVGSWIFSRFS